MAETHFYRTFAGDPYYNMAFDEWLFDRALRTPGSLYVRMYLWNPGTITFGYNQKQETALDFSRAGDTPVIRRITGGRALYHDPSEFTYAVAVNTDASRGAVLSGSLADTSRALAGALEAFLQKVGVEAHYVRGASPSDARPEFFHKAPCFASSARYELETGGRKIVASAQKRLPDALLQHGSIKLHGVASHPALDVDRKVLAVNVQPIDRKEFDITAQQFCEAVGEALGVSLVEDEIGDRERAELSLRCDYVKKNALTRRVTFAQSGYEKSLLGSHLQGR